MLGRPAKDLAGQTFGRLTVVSRFGTAKDGHALWLCNCSEGNQVKVISRSLLNGETKSCGCLQREIVSEANKLHGKSRTKLYRVWSGIKERCDNSNNISFKHYGDRGIRYCPEWAEFEPFMKWALQNGYKEDLIIDRKNNNEGYSPDNCRWVNIVISNRNRRGTREVTAFGESKLLIEWTEDVRCKVIYPTLLTRLDTGWTTEAAITTPPRKKNI